jgi:small subunit ribosomal protein S30
MQARVIKNVFKKPKFTRNLATALQHEVQSDVAEYPPIVDTSLKAKKQRQFMEVQEKVKKCPSIEEKIIQINMPKFYGFKCLMLNDRVYPYNSLPFVQYITKTDYQTLPNIGEEESKSIDVFMNLIKAEFLDALEFELDTFK